MSKPAYVVIRLVPDSPVDGAAFSSYLDGLSLKLTDADDPTKTVSEVVEVSPLTLFEWPPGSGQFVTTAAQTTFKDASYVADHNYDKTLTFTATDGISVGAFVYSADQTTIPPSAGLTVTDIKPTTVTLSGNLPNYVPAGTTVSFAGSLPSGSIDTTQQPPVVQFTCDPVSGSPTAKPKTLNFNGHDADGIPMGALLSPLPGHPGLIAAGTTVTSATDSTLGLSKALTGPLPASTTLTLTFQLSSRIFQHYEVIQNGWSFGGAPISILPAAAATAVLPLTENKPPYLDVQVAATRNNVAIPDNSVYYNVQAPAGDEPPQTPVAYQGLPASDTGLYFFLPPPPTSAAIAVDAPADGTPPPLEPLLAAMQSALGNDPVATLTTLVNSADKCRRIAYDIVWSYRNALPTLPDPLESLYTNPPNAGGGGTTSSNGNGSNNFEMDRQKFEGALSSFYAMRNASAERLTKFVAAASGALACEQLSRNAASALLDFPVDPADSSFATAVESEVRLTDLGDGGAAGLDFGVPGAYFYALGVSLDKTAGATTRFQHATDDSIDRLLHHFAAAQDMGLITPDAAGPQTFHDGSAGITAFQAARRLVALGVSAASTSPQAKVTAGTKLADLVTAWLAATDPGAGAIQGPPPTYQQKDFGIWAGLVGSQPAGYLDLDLAALTKGATVPSGATLASEIATQLAPVAAAPTVATLRGITAGQWTKFFQVDHPDWLPPLTQPVPGTPPGALQDGYTATRVRAFIRAVQRFFTVSTAVTASSIDSVGEIPLLPAPSATPGSWYDPVGAAIGAITFNGAVSASALDTAAQGVFPDDSAAQAWLVGALTALNDLWQIAGQATSPDSGSTLPPAQASFRFSVMEALYARGFRSAADVTALSAADFQLALTGTVGYDSAGALYTAAGKIASGSSSSSPPESGFTPVNPDGTLVDCVPPPCLSPTGPVAYLQEMLTVTSAPGAPTLGTVLATRRGQLGTLAASAANLEIPLPLADLVNECLEALTAAATETGTPVAGVVYDTVPTAAPGADDDNDDLARLLAAAPQHATPAPPDAANTAVEPTAFNKLRDDFSACELPYSQPLDVSRGYLGLLGSSRFAQLRAFRRDITEFVLDPAHEPTGFESYLWRLPVRADIAIEYLGITPEEYAALYQGDSPPVAADGRMTLPEFLAATCLTYCEFYELWESGVVPFRAVGDNTGDGSFPPCEPCCPEQVWLEFPQQGEAELLIFVRLWRSLRGSCHGYTFSELRGICDALKLWLNDAPNPDFIRQLAAFQMLRDDLRLPLAGPAAAAPGATRPQLLALWGTPGAAGWDWAVRELIAGIKRDARVRPGCQPREPGFARLLADNLDPLSRLAGFDPGSPTDSWHAQPTHTLRFAEVLSKVYASDFTVGELIFLFTAGPHLDGDDPFPLPEGNEALDDPLDLPDDRPEASLWRLRGELAAAEDEGDEDDEEMAGNWPWRRIESALAAEFGFDPADVVALGQHFFPGAAGGSPPAAWFTTALDTGSTSAARWNSPPDGPFHYDMAAGGQLSTRLPLSDRAVLHKLAEAGDLGPAERHAVQDLFFQPRALLAGFALLFSDFARAQCVLIEEPDEARRLAWFRREFLLCRRRARLIAAHLARHVAAVTAADDEGTRPEEADHDDAALILRTLAADGNRAKGGWRDDSGTAPPLTWPGPAGGALAALLALAGTGVTAEYRRVDGSLAWRDQSAGLGGFCHERDRENCPVPTVLPALDAPTSPGQLRRASVHNGLLLADATDTWLGGAQGFGVTWSGALLVERDGTYEFWAGGPAAGADRPDFDLAEGRAWRVVLRRGQRTWVILSHHWDGTEERTAASLPLKRGAYDLTAQFTEPTPEFRDADDVRRRRTGFLAEYRGPDSAGQRVEIPHRVLFTTEVDKPLSDGLKELSGELPALSDGATAYLDGLYQGSLRDIRRTYQRAFKALLLCRRLRLSARRQPHGTSELGYLLSQPHLFAGSGYYRDASGFTRHAADFDFDFLPVRDDYHAPAQGTDARTDPTPQRVQAMFDWWERLFDYAAARADVRHRSGRALWHLFEEAQAKQPAQPGYLLRHLDVDARDWELCLRYFQDQSSPVYPVTSADLSDDRWTVRAWHADRWLRAMRHRFAAPGVETARPDLWASDDPSAALPTGTGTESQSGNANLIAFATAGCLSSGEPRRYDDLRAVNDGLRERGRRTLIAYLCQQGRVPLPWQPGQSATKPADLSDLLLLDVEAGLRQRASRIEEACSAVQAFVRRARLGLEPDWPVTGDFARRWASRYETYQTWARARRRELYPESWIEWDEIAAARGIEAFRFLESRLRAATLTVAAPGGDDWWPDDASDLERAPERLQRRVPSRIRPLPSPVVPATREGFTTIGHPDYAGQPSWLAVVQQPDGSAGNGTGTGTTGDGTGTGTGTSTGTTRDGTGTGTRTTIQATTVATQPPGTGSVTLQSLVTAAAVARGAQAKTLPLWMTAAMQLGTRFTRVAAAGVPDAGSRFAPRHEPGPRGVDEYCFWLVPARVYTPPPADTDNSAADEQSAAPAFTSSYQFGYQDPYYDQVQQQSTVWDDDTQLPKLLASWLPERAVRLAWCQVRDGEFGQPRRSTQAVSIGDAEPDLVLLGRAWDSLYLEVTGITATGGFRYDLAADEAVALPEDVPATLPSVTYPAPFPSYPFFVYDDPGARLFPASWFATSLTVAGALRARCGHELALRWYRRAFDPLRSDCAWAHCTADEGGGGSGDRESDGTTVTAATAEAAAPSQAQISQRAEEIWEQHGRPDGEDGQVWQQAEAELRAEAARQQSDKQAAAAAAEGGKERAPRQGACCDATDVTAQGARDRAVTLHYCRTLVEWGDDLMRRGHAPEMFQQARVLYETAARITGLRPRVITLPDPAPGAAATVATFVPAYPPLNPRLMDLYDLIADRLGLVRESLDAQRLRNRRSGRDMPYFASRETAVHPDGESWCRRPSPYRFLPQVQKAIELAGRARELGSALLSAYEKGDAEYLAALHAEQEREMQALGIAVRQDQWRDADWQVQALQQTKDLNQVNLLYYAGLYSGGLLNDENQNLDLTTDALLARTGATIVETVGEMLNIIPDPFVGAMSSGAAPPAGTKLARMFEAMVRILQVSADILGTTAAMDLTQANWQRRAVDWLHQTQALPVDIQRGELEILGAHRRRDLALRELNNQQRQVEHASEVLDFLRGKFTAADLYLWLQQETSALYRQMYELALQAAREAERAFNFELRDGEQRFIPDDAWNDRHAGLLAGERLDLALRRMEKAYLDQNKRELELTKHISLRLDFPLAYLRLRVTGYCEIDIPEWLYARDYPTHYLRRLRAVRTTLPMTASPLTGVHASLTLLSSMTRISPEVAPPAQHCCHDDRRRDEYQPCADDPRVIRDYAAREAIATSEGQNDAGLFELSFRDERYLPFEYQGAASRWRIELPPENNYFDLDTLTDMLLHISYTAREGGPALGEVAAREARGHLPGDGLRVFDVRYDFPDAWPGLRGHDDPAPDAERHARPRRLRIGLTRAMFPFIPGHPACVIDRLQLLFAAPDAVPGRHHLVRFWAEGTDPGEADEIESVADGAWPGFFRAMVDLRDRPLGPLRDGRPTSCLFELPPDTGEVRTAFLVASYDVARLDDRPCDRPSYGHVG